MSILFTLSFVYFCIRVFLYLHSILPPVEPASYSSKRTSYSLVFAICLDFV